MITLTQKTLLLSATVYFSTNEATASLSQSFCLGFHNNYRVDWKVVNISCGSPRWLGVLNVNQLIPLTPSDPSQVFPPSRLAKPELSQTVWKNIKTQNKKEKICSLI